MRRSFPIVGIGASAGGIEALRHFFEAMPPAPGCGFVIVTHSNPDLKSYLAEVVARLTTLPVAIATDGARIEINRVYVAPAGAVLGVAGGCLTVAQSSGRKRERRPIDAFFGALAIDQGHAAVGVVLSGANADGALGIKALKERGGLTLAQVADGHPPSYSEMPNRAILTGRVDLLASVTEMGEQLAHFARAFASGPNARSDIAAIRSDAFAAINAQIGYDFSDYKPKSVDRRIERRMLALKLDEPDAYLARLHADPQEVATLFRDLLIRVTSFFRDAEAFDALARIAIPKILENRKSSDPVRVWAPGCSTGEEAYSLAIVLHEAMAGLKDGPHVQIFATDIDDGALTIARAGIYPQERLDGVSVERRDTFFTREGASRRVTKKIRDMCVFSVHSVLKDPPFSQIDLISCRNLLIYFGSAAQNDVVPIFRYALKPGGFLFLGASENISRFKNLFDSVDKKSRLFKARDGIALPIPLSISHTRRSLAKGVTILKPQTSPQALKAIAQEFVLDKYTPPHVIVTDDGEIVLYSARTGKYFETPPGQPSQQLLAMARRGLRLPLRSLLTQVKESGLPVVYEQVDVAMDDGRHQPLSLNAAPLPTRGGDTYYVILFDDKGTPLEADDTRVLAPGTRASIEDEHRDMQDRLQSVIEEYETALEELKSSNEELMSMNEEFQSANEELESSKEELQSVNEELHTVNIELNEKLEALSHANSDLHHMLENSLIATLFLDQEFKIRMYTPSMKTFFSIREIDIGRAVSELATSLIYPDFEGDLLQVRRSRMTSERSVPVKQNHSAHRVRIVASTDSNGSFDGAIVTIVGETLLAN